MAMPFQLISPELRLQLHEKATTETISRHGHQVPGAPDPRLVELCTHLGAVWGQSLNCWRMGRMLDIAVEGGADPLEVSGVDFTEVASVATARIAPHLAAAQVLAISHGQLASLPELDPAETHETLITERLPWETTWIEINARPVDCPVVVQVRLASGEELDAHMIGALCRQLPTGIELSPVLTLGQSDEPCSPLAARYLPAFSGGGELGMSECAPGGDALAWNGIAGPEHSLASAEDIANACARRVAAALMVLSAVNVDYGPRRLTGKRQRRWERERHPLPHVVTVRSRPGEREETSGGGGGALTGSHMVRGHWMHFTKGPVFDAHPEARRWIPGLECDAVRIWRGGHVRGPRDGPSVPTVVNLV